MDRRREQLREGGGDGLHQRMGLNKEHIPIYREAHGGKHEAEAFDILPSHSGRLGQHEPLVYPALPFFGAIMIDDPMDPRPAEGRIVGLAQDGRILFRNETLIVETVGDPGMQLSLRQLPFVHQQVERVLVVIPFLAHRSESLRKFIHAQPLWGSARVHSFSFFGSYTSRSMPSNATSHPAFSTIRRSEESSISIGFVLLM